MANELSVELGWIITKSKENDDYYDGGADSLFFNSILKNQPDAEEVGYVVPGTENHSEGADPDALNVETHPNDLTRVFVSWCTPGHGWTDLTEPPGLSQIVRQFIAQHDPDAHVTWGIIETER